MEGVSIVFGAMIISFFITKHHQALSKRKKGDEYDFKESSSVMYCSYFGAAFFLMAVILWHYVFLLAAAPWFWFVHCKFNEIDR
ncbi:MAG: hypothetical protein ACQEUN_16330 [Pseudomonadota bacterium]